MENRRKFLKKGASLSAAYLTSPFFGFGQDPEVNREKGTLFMERVFDPTLAQTSYIIASRETKEAIVIDPKRDIDTYLDIAEKYGLKITKVTETHIHADFLSGTRELAAATGAELILSGETDPGWAYHIPHTPIKDGEKMQVGKIVIEAMHTPGHTPESLTYLLTDLSVSDAPQKAFTGDFVFVGDVGRPDLLEKVAGQKGSQNTGAKQLYASIQRFSKLPDELEIWPGHGAGSFCGKSLSDIPQSTLKQEKLNNKAFQFTGNENNFIRYILDGQPEPPKYFAVMKNSNRVPRPLLIKVPRHTVLTKEELLSAQKQGLTIVDTRKQGTAAKGYIPGSMLIEGNNSFSTFMGWLLDYQKQLILVADEAQKEDLTRKLMRIGMDNIHGFVTNIPSTGIVLQQADEINKTGFKSYLNDRNTQVIDVRSLGEYQSGHVPKAENIAVAELEGNLDKISRDKQVIVHCKSGVRAAMAYSILRNKGFKNVKLYPGDLEGLTETAR